MSSKNINTFLIAILIFVCVVSFQNCSPKNLSGDSSVSSTNASTHASLSNPDSEPSPVASVPANTLGQNNGGVDGKFCAYPLYISLKDHSGAPVIPYASATLDVSIFKDAGKTHLIQVSQLPFQLVDMNLGLIRVDFSEKFGCATPFSDCFANAAMSDSRYIIVNFEWGNLICQNP